MNVHENEYETKRKKKKITTFKKRKNLKDKN